MAIKARRSNLYEQARQAIKNARAMTRLSRILSDEASLMRLEQARRRQEISSATARLRQSRLSLNRA